MARRSSFCGSGLKTEVTPFRLVTLVQVAFPALSAVQGFLAKITFKMGPLERSKSFLVSVSFISKMA